MIFLQVVCLLIVLVFFVLLVSSIFGISLDSKHAKQRWEALPRVSLLLAARNEEKLILRSLKSIEKLDYPKDKLDVLIGDDQSSDNTKKIIEDFIKDKNNFRLFEINENLGNGRGKANVLAHLAHKARGAIYLITDVDVKLPNNWVKSFVGVFTPKVGIVSGTTMCEVRPDIEAFKKAKFLTKLFSKMQAIDWLHFMGYIKAFANHGISCTSVGNNMAVRAEAYWQTGGYEKIPFSITEDYKLFEEVTKRGWAWRNLANADTLGQAYFLSNFYEMLHQRKRWLIGAQDLPWNWKFMLGIYGLFYPILIVLMLTNFTLAMFFWGIKFFLQVIFITQLVQKVDIKQWKWYDYVLYELYLFGNTVVSALYFLWPGKSVWKGRVYNKKNTIA